VVVARDGSEVRDLTEHDSFDVVVLGPLRSEAESLTVCRGLRLEETDLPIVLLVGQDGAEARVRGLDAGADDCVPLECPVDELLARLRALVRRSTRSATG
jgi:DNA-binding response OmpR family regulator